MIHANVDLPGLDCGLCGFRTCNELSAQIKTDEGMQKRCIHMKDEKLTRVGQGNNTPANQCIACEPSRSLQFKDDRVINWLDSLGREFDFYLEHFPEDPGPREIILPHNPIMTRELNIRKGDILIGRPLGMSCGCPITHCGIVMEVDGKTGVIVWCVTGPLNPREKGYKDLGYYIAEGYEGLITQNRCEIKIGMRYYFQPRMCMLQWRHSGLVNFLNYAKDGLQVRVEGLWIG